MKSRSWMLLAAVVAVLVSGSLVRGVDLPESAQLVPEDTLFMLEIGNAGQLVEKFKQTRTGQLYQDPSMQRFVRKLEEKVRQMVTENEDAAKVMDKLVLPTGRVILALRANASPDKEPSFVLVAQWGEKLDEGRQFVQAVIDAGMEDRDRVRKEDLSGVEMTHIQWAVEEPDFENWQPGSEEGENGGEMPMKKVEKHLLYGYLDDVLLVSDAPDLAEFVIAHVRGGGGTLAGRRAYGEIVQTTGAKADIRLYGSVQKPIEQVMESDPEARQMMTALGIDQLGAMAMGLEVAPGGGASYRGKAMVQLTGQRKGLWQVLNFADGSYSPPNWLGADTTSVAYLNWNVPQAFDALFATLAQIQPMLAGMLNSPLTPPQADGSGGVTLRKDIVAYLGSQIVAAEAQGAGSPAGPQLPVIGIATSNAKALENSLAALHSAYILPRQPQSQREFLGRKIYLLSGFGPQAESAGMSGMAEVQVKAEATEAKVAFAFTDTHVVLGSVEDVEQALRTLADKDTRSPAQADWYRQGMSLLPSQVAMASVTNQRAQMRQLWKMVKSGEFASMPGLSMVANGMNLKELLDGSLLPEFEAVEKYFGIGVSYMKNRPDGYYFEFTNVEWK